MSDMASYAPGSPPSATAALPPGAVIGVLGSGQLGRMFAIAAAQLGYRVWTLSPDCGSPAGQVCEREVVAAYDDIAAIRQFAACVAALTFEFENIPAASTRAAASLTRVRPTGGILEICQHRLREKRYLAEQGFPVAPFHEVNSPAELNAACTMLGYPAILKTAGFGYDGKGQARIRGPADLAAAWQSTDIPERVLEGWIDFKCEVSVIIARNIRGETRTWGVMENHHEQGILAMTIAPARIDPSIAAAAAELACRIAARLDLVGVLCVECFITHDGQVLVNELAPRPHNSGHVTIEAAPCSQFEQLARIVAGLPMGATEISQPAAMVNLLGDVWEHGEPCWEAALAIPGVHLHLYGKDEPRPGRKMGHLTVLAETADRAVDLALAAKAALRPNAS